MSTEPEQHSPSSTQSSTPSSPTAPAAKPTSTGLDPSVNGLLAYLLGWVSGLVLLLVEKEHRETRFHAAQSLLLSVGLVGVWIVLGIVGMVPVIGILAWVASMLLAVASVALWVWLCVQGYQQRHVRLPVIGPMAENLAAKG